jgi:outer membrane immunogenic protein
MKKLLLAGASFAALIAGPAMAADLARPIYRAPVMYAPVASWTGFYVGVNVGGTWSDNNSINTVATPISAFNAGAVAEQNALVVATTTNQSVRNNGFIGGGQVGYNYQLSNWVAGLEADIQGIARSNNSTNLPVISSLAPFGLPLENYTGTVSVSRTLNYLGTVRGRFGLLVTPNLLAYATGGLAYGGISTSNSFAFVENGGVGPGTTLPLVAGVSGTSTTRAGWTVGAGGEWMLTSNWTARLEYLHYDLGSVTDSTTLVQTIGLPGPFHTTLVQTNTRFAGDIVRVGLNYKFGGYAAAPAVYK